MHQPDRTASPEAIRSPRLFFVLAVVSVWAGCGEPSISKTPRAQTSNQTTLLTGNIATPSTSILPANSVRSFSTRGVIREIPTNGAALVVRHEAIPGFMPKMTMEFTVRHTNELQGLRPGDTITFQVQATEEDSWIEGIQKTTTNTLSAPPLAPTGAAALLNAGQLKVGDLLPDVSLLAKDGRTIQLSDFAGQAVAFTFIFTRCPLPDFCPRMNQHFSRARDLLGKEPGGPTNWQFLSISFDPDFDRPGVLTRYAYSYRGPQADRWLFAAAPTDVMSSLVAQLDFRFANEGGSFVHNLRTVVLDTRGRIRVQFEGNKWKATELAEAMAAAARVGP